MYVTNLNDWATNNVVGNNKKIRNSEKDREDWIAWSNVSAQISTQTALTVNIYYMKITIKIDKMFNFLLIL